MRILQNPQNPSTRRLRSPKFKAENINVIILILCLLILVARICCSEDCANLNHITILGFMLNGRQLGRRSLISQTSTSRREFRV